MKNEIIKFNRINLLAGFDCADKIYAYDAKGDFRHGFSKLRIAKNCKTGFWDLKALDTGCRFTNYREGFATRREAIQFAFDRLV